MPIGRVTPPKKSGNVMGRNFRNEAVRDAGWYPPAVSRILPPHATAETPTGGPSIPPSVVGAAGSAASGVGTKIERYRVEELLGRGGMGEVYRAVDERLRRSVALKMVRPEMLRDGSSDAVARLFREARAAAALAHPNLVAIHDIGESGGVFYIVMELVRGRPLLAYIGDESVGLPRRLRWLIDIARALACAHRGGVLHRDVKPSNVMVTDEDMAKVLDFGLARPVERQSGDFRTQVGHVVGTDRYMAPEQLAGCELDTRCDQYSFGVTAYELLSSTYPEYASMGEPMPLDVIAPLIPRNVALVVARTMRALREERFRGMEDVVTALEDIAHGKPIRVSLSIPAHAGSAQGLPVALPATVRDPHLDIPTIADAAPTILDAIGPGTVSLPPHKLPPIFGATVRSGESLELRRAAHVRAHDATRTLLSREAPTGLRPPMMPPRPAFASTTAPLTSGAHPFPQPRERTVGHVAAVQAPGVKERTSPTLVLLTVVLMTVAAGIGMFIGWHAQASSPGVSPAPVAKTPHSAAAAPLPESSE